MPQAGTLEQQKQGAVVGVVFALLGPRFVLLEGVFDEPVHAVGQLEPLAEYFEAIPQIHELDGGQNEPLLLGEESLRLLDCELLHRQRLAGDPLLVLRRIAHEILNGGHFGGVQLALAHEHHRGPLVRVDGPRPLAVLAQQRCEHLRLAPVQLQTVHPQHLPEAQVMELRPVVLRLPRVAVPFERLLDVALHELEPALEEEEPHAVRVGLQSVESQRSLDMPFEARLPAVGR